MDATQVMVRQGPRLGLALLVGALLLLAAGALLLVSEDSRAAALIDNGVIQLGVDDCAQLNINTSPYGGPPCHGSVLMTPASCSGTSPVGLRFMSTGCESTAPGCVCEGWGAAYDGTTSGYANNAGVTTGLTLISFTSTASTALSVTQAGDLQITHDFHPAAATPNMYEVEVTLENLGTASMSDVVYRRVMDWDIEPTAFNEYVTIFIPASPPLALAWACANGFATSDPLSPGSAVCGGYLPAFPGSGFTDGGPDDHGSLFDFNFGILGPGATRTFQIYYGAAGSETAVLTAIADVACDIWSIGQTSTDPLGGTPNSFTFCFSGLDLPKPTADFTFEYEDPATKWTYDDVYFYDNSTIPPELPFTPTLSWSWDLGDPIDLFGTDPAFVEDPIHVYVDGKSPTVGGLPYKVCMTLTIAYEDLEQNDTVCKDVPINNRPPTPDFTWIFLGELDARVFDASSDMDGIVVGWSWDYGDGSPPVSGSPNPAPHTYPKSGTFPVCLTATDDDGDSSVTCKDIVIPNRPPVLDPILAKKVLAGSTVAFTVTGYDPDEDDTTTFGADGLPPGAAFNPLTQKFTWTPTEAQVGVHSGIVFKITDNHGLWDLEDVRILVYTLSTDADEDGVTDIADNCPELANYEQADSDGDGVGDLCDGTPIPSGSGGGGDTGPSGDPPAGDATGGWVVGTDGALLPDSDRDGVADVSDNCPARANRGQEDMDGDEEGDACDMDLDGDTVPQQALVPGVFLDNCPLRPNTNQADLDGDGLGDACDGAGPAVGGGTLGGQGCATCGDTGIEPQELPGSGRGSLASSMREPGTLIGLALGVAALALVTFAAVAWVLKRRK